MPPLGGGDSLPLPRGGKPGETQVNGSYSRSKDPSHSIAVLVVNCPLLGPTVETASTWDSSTVVVCVHNTAVLLSISRFVQYVHCTVCTMCTLVEPNCFLRLAKSKANTLIFVLD